MTDRGWQGPGSRPAGFAGSARRTLPGKAADCEEAVKDLASRGFEVDMSTAKYKPDGTLNAVYRYYSALFENVTEI